MGVLKTVRGIVGLTALIAVAGCMTLRTDITKERALLETDRAFAQMSLAQGGAAAMRAMLASTTSMLSRTEGEYIGADQAALAFPAPTLPGEQDIIYWNPEKAWVSADDALGVTSGRFVRIRNGAQREQGRYANVWRRDETGRWRSELMLMNNDTPPAPPAVLVRPTPTPTPPRRRR